jgi:hypothetical protein
MGLYHMCLHYWRLEYGERCTLQVYQYLREDWSLKPGGLRPVSSQRPTE